MTSQRRRSAGILLATCLTAALVAPSASVGAEGVDRDVEFRDPNVSDPGYQIVIFKDQTVGGTGGLSFSYLSGGPWGTTCSSFSDPACSDTSRLSYHAFLQPCATTEQLDCISGFGAATETNERTAASLVGTFPSRGRHDFTGDASLRLPPGGPPSMWSIPSQPHVGGTKYLVQVSTSGTYRNGAFSLNNFAIEVVPIELVSDNGRQCDVNEECDDDEGPGFYVVQEIDGEPVRGLASRVSSSDNDCVILAERQCAKRHAFPAGARLYLTLRMSQSPTGWFHGRVYKPNISVTPITGSGVVVDIVASTVKTPVLAVAKAWSDLPGSLQDVYRATGGFKGADPGTRNRREILLGPEIRNAISSPSPSSEVGMEELLAWLPHVGDRATADIARWTIRSLADNELAGASQCFADRSQLNGLVTTNATQYSGGPPKFDRASGSLDYRVAAPHYTSGGNLVVGTYDLVMRSSVARCVYGFSNAPLNASISVVESDGQTTVATKSVSERDGWIRIAAYGFGFSSPTIKVQLTQDKVSTTSPSKSPKAKTPTKTKRSITCKKGRVARVVTAVNPICPKGFTRVP